jgi:hypothetical protein
MARVHVEAKNDRAPVRKAPRRRRWWSVALRPATALAVLAIAAAGVAGYLIGNEDGGGTTTQTIQAKATPEEPMARGNVVKTGDAAVVNVASLPVPHSGRVYQTWLQRGMKIEPSSLFVVGKDGSGTAVVTGDLDGVDAVMVSEEPSGGSRQPTTKPVLIANL